VPGNRLIANVTPLLHHSPFVVAKSKSRLTCRRAVRYTQELKETAFPGSNGGNRVSRSWRPMRDNVLAISGLRPDIMTGLGLEDTQYVHGAA
jgi:hypothetical protein